MTLTATQNEVSTVAGRSRAQDRCCATHAEHGIELPLRTTQPSKVQTTLDFIAATAEWLMDNGDRFLRDGDIEAALKCQMLAARELMAQNRDLVHPRIEASLQRIARTLPARPWQRPAERAKGRRESWLHVFTEAIHLGGHTAMAMNWMRNDTEDRSHSAALLCQRQAIPKSLANAVRLSGGEVFITNPDAPLLRRAEWLRELARVKADRIVLHVHMDDVVPVVAFGVPGGPPVMIVNHAAHIYWAGASIADLIVNCRGSKLETHWTTHHRGTARCATIPIPLEPSLRTVTKAEARKQLGLLQDELLILTVGTGYKYVPAGDLNFFAACEDVLKQIPNGRVVAVGPDEDERWKTARDRTAGRFLTVGKQSRERVALYQQAADIYIEGFPFGSTTAVMEAGLRGLPSVLAPAQCPPPCGTDGIALDETVARPATVDEYKARVLELSRDASLRENSGRILRESILRHHCGDGWREHLESAIKNLPARHGIYEPTMPPRTPESIQEYWMSFQARQGLRFEKAVDSLLALNYLEDLPLRMTSAMRRACRSARDLRYGHTVPLPVLAVWSALRPILPKGASAEMLRRIHWRCAPEGRTMMCLNAVLPRAIW